MPRGPSGGGPREVDSPFLGLYRTGPEHDYLIELSEIPFDPADFNHDRRVDGDDLAIWQTNFGNITGAGNGPGDANNDGGVDGADFLIWQAAAAPTPWPRRPAARPRRRSGAPSRAHGPAAGGRGR